MGEEVGRGGSLLGVLRLLGVVEVVDGGSECGVLVRHDGYWVIR